MGEKVASEPKSESIVKKIIRTYTCIAIWIFFSASVIIYNKYILDKKFYNWPFPLSLSMLHMGFSSVLAFVLVRFFGVIEAANMSKSFYVNSVVPIGVLYAISLWLSNSAYIYLSVSFIQMLKALMPVLVYSTEVLFKLKSFEGKIMANALVISIGVAIAAYGEAKFDVYGVIIQLTALIAESSRLVLVEILLKSKGVKLNSIATLYYVAPACFVSLLVPWSFVELPKLRMQQASFEFSPVLFGMNFFCAFGLNLAVFYLISNTSALTMNVAGVVKDWLLISISWSVIKDVVTGLNLVGYVLAFLGVSYYNYNKLQRMKEAQKKEVINGGDNDRESGKLLDSKESDWVTKKVDSQV